MTHPLEFPPKGFHIEPTDTPFGPTGILAENEGFRPKIDLLVEVVEVDDTTAPQVPS